MADNSIAEIAQTTLRDNFIFYSIIALLLSQVGSWATKIIQIMRRKDRKEETINKIAMDIVKLKEKYWEKDHAYLDMEYPAMTYFMYMRDVLTNNVRYTEGYLEHIGEKENKISKKIKELERKISELEKEKDDLYYVKESQKIPDSVAVKVAEATKRYTEALLKTSGHIRGENNFVREIHDIYTHKLIEITEEDKKEEK